MALKTFEVFKDALANSSEVENCIENNSLATLVEKQTVLSNKDAILSAERYFETEVLQTEFEIVKLGDVVEINSKAIDPIKAFGNDTFTYIDIESVENGTGKITLNKIIKTADAPSRARRLVKDGDVIISTVRPNLKAFAYLENVPKNCVVSTGFAVLSENEKVNGKYLYYIVNQDSVVKQMVSMSDKGQYPSITASDVAELEFPLPPIEIQQQIVAEIEGYQKVLDGAKQVVNNYKPTITINPAWEMVELDQLCDVRDGTHDSPKYVLSSGVPFVTQKNITKQGLSFEDINFISEEDHRKIIKRSNVEYGDIIISMIGANRGMSCLINDERVFSIKNVGLIKSTGKINHNFLLHYLKSPTALDYISLMSSGGAQQFIGLTSLRKFPIPVPDILEQTKIVKAIEEEIQIVDANKKLIQLFEAKIKNKIAEVWGVKDEVEV